MRALLCLALLTGCSSVTTNNIYCYGSPCVSAPTQVAASPAPSRKGVRVAKASHVFKPPKIK